MCTWDACLVIAADSMEKCKIGQLLKLLWASLEVVPPPKKNLKNQVFFRLQLVCVFLPARVWKWDSLLCWNKYSVLHCNTAFPTVFSTRPTCSHTLSLFSSNGSWVALSLIHLIHQYPALKLPLLQIVYCKCNSFFESVFQNNQEHSPCRPAFISLQLISGDKNTHRSHDITFTVLHYHWKMNISFSHLGFIAKLPLILWLQGCSWSAIKHTSYQSLRGWVIYLSSLSG